jgi:hypothetical protein
VAQLPAFFLQPYYFVADYLGLTIETVSRVLWDLERRGAFEISGRHSIVLLIKP